MATLNANFIEPGLSWADQVEQEERNIPPLVQSITKTYQTHVDYQPCQRASAVTLPITPLTYANGEKIKQPLKIYRSEQERNSESKREEKLDELLKLGVPFLTKEALRSVKDYIRTFKKQLCDRSFSYPALFSGTISEFANQKFRQRQLFFLEIHNRKNIYLLFNIKQNPKTYIGEGMFKCIYKAWNLCHPALHAYTESQIQDVKDNKKSNNRLEAAKREETFLLKFRGNPRAPEVHATFWYPDSFIAIMNYYRQGDLFDYLADELKLSPLISITPKDKPVFTDHQKLELALEILTIVVDWHEAGCIHRDIKLENFLKNNQSVILMDFGFACQKTDTEHKRDTCGTLTYAAPELLKQDLSQLGCALDIWATGCILYVIFADKTYPWYHILNNLRDQVFQSQFDKAFALMECYHRTPISAENKIAQLLWEMLHLNPKKRITAKGTFDRLKNLISDLKDKSVCSFANQFQDPDFYIRRLSKFH